MSKSVDTAAAVAALNKRPELAEIFPLGTVLDSWVRWSA